MKNARFAILGDIHSNWEALSSVLEDAEKQGVTAYVCVGDIVGYNADPALCLEKVIALGCLTVRGNHDHYCSHEECLEDFHPLAANVIDWTRRQLSKQHVEFLRSLKLVRNVHGFSVVHSTLDMPEKWGYVFDTLEAEASFNYQATFICFFGHTHSPIVYEKRGRVTSAPADKTKLTVGRKYFINVGSVGQPRDGDPRAAYAVYDGDQKIVEVRRIEYDIEAAQGRIRKVGLPERLAHRLELGK